MAKLRKMMGSADSPYIVSLMRLIETQSKSTLAEWAIDYAEENFIPIYDKDFPDDPRAREALGAARDWLDGIIKLPEAKKKILDAHSAAREAEGHPAAQAAVRAVGQAAAVIHAPTHSIGMAFYGSAAIAYDRAGLDKTNEEYDEIAERECTRMEAALRAISVDDEPNPAKLNWNC